MEIDTLNKFCVGVQGREIVFLLPVPRRLTRVDALTLAAFIVAVAEYDPEGIGPTFADVLTAVRDA